MGIGLLVPRCTNLLPIVDIIPSIFLCHCLLSDGSSTIRFWCCSYCRLLLHISTPNHLQKRFKVAVVPMDFIQPGQATMPFFHPGGILNELHLPEMCKIFGKTHRVGNLQDWLTGLGISWMDKTNTTGWEFTGLKNKHIGLDMFRIHWTGTKAKM